MMRFELYMLCYNLHCCNVIMTVLFQSSNDPHSSSLFQIFNTGVSKFGPYLYIEIGGLSFIFTIVFIEVMYTNREGIACCILRLLWVFSKVSFYQD